MPDLHYCHQQYLDRNPDGYCGLGSNGVKLSDRSADGSCPTGIASTDG